MYPLEFLIKKSLHPKHTCKPLLNVSSSAVLAAAFLAGTCHAQGSFIGRITDASGNVGMEGALVVVKELNLKTTSARDGRFSLQQLPPGSYTIEIHYLGSKSLQKTITINDDETLVEQLTLSVDDNVDEEVLVYSQAASLNKALNKQRASNSIVNVVNADAIGQYPDANTSEALQRLPGVSVENDQGEGRFVRIRGLGPNYNSVTINGSKVPSPNAGERAVALDTVPSDLLESLEVTKTLTPDMDADSLGGTINVKSLSAFDRNGLFYRASAEANYDSNTSKTSPKLSLSGSNLFALGGEEDNFGVAAAISWFDRDFGSDNVETGGSWDFDNPARLEEFEQRDYTINRERLGVSLNFDFKPNENTDLFLRSLYSEFTDTEIRLANVYEIYEFETDDSGNIIEDDEGDPVTIDGLPQDQYGAAAVARELKDRKETMKIASLVLGGESRLNTWTFNYRAGISQSSEDTPYYVDKAAFEAEFDGGVRYTNDKLIYPELPSEVFNAESYELDKIETAQSLTEDEEYNLQIDIEKQLRLGKVPTALKFGAKASQREKTSDEDVWVFEDLDEAGFTEEQLLLSAYTGSTIDYALGNMGNSIATDKVWQAIAPLNRADYVADIDSAIADFTMDENITAAYAMATFDINRLRLIAGVRVEQTDFEASGFSYAEYEADGEEIEDLYAETHKNDYSHTLPSLHLRYSFSDKSQLRAAWTNAVVRPTFEQLSAAKIREGDEVEFGNPYLSPLEASNLDIGFEHFGGYASYWSAFVFYKELDNFIYAIDLGDTADPSLVGPGEVSEANTFKNGKAATISGLELAASKKFNELPAPWNGLLLSANGTWSDSDAEIEYLDDDVFNQRDIPMPSQSEFTGNLALGYEISRFSARIAANYKSDYLLEITDASDEIGDVYVDSQLSLDLLARWNITKYAQVFVQAVNLGDEPYYVYINKKRYNNQYEEYGPTYRLGVSFSRF